MNTPTKTIIDEYALKYSLSDKEVIELLCDYIYTVEHCHETFDSALETFLENKMLAK